MINQNSQFMLNSKKRRAEADLVKKIVLNAFPHPPKPEPTKK